MIKSLELIEEKPYEVMNDKIGYREFDGINFELHYGYITMFCYHKEYKNQRISQTSYMKNVGF
jgi:hypothetical protein